MSTLTRYTASMIYAMSQGGKCDGDQECHYCGGPCTRLLTHGEPVQVHTGRPAGGVRLRPGNPYVCVGCWMWGFKRVSAPHLSGGVKDGVAPKKRSWLVSAEAKDLTPACGPKLYERLLSPPPLFFLALLEGDSPPDNLIQCAVANVCTDPKADTPFWLTVNNARHRYTVYELEQAALHGPEGREPGVRALLRLFGPVPKELVTHVIVDRAESDEKQEHGRPKKSPGRHEDVRRPVGGPPVKKGVA